jgi:hypothetical protein
MAWNENASEAKQRHIESSDPLASAEDLKQRLEEFASRLRQLKEQEPVGPSREWLEEAERRHEMLKASLDDYRKGRAEQRTNESAWDRTRRNAQTRYQSLQHSTRTGARNIARGIRKSWEGIANAFTRGYGLRNAFNRAFGRDQKQRHQEHESGRVAS